VTRPDHQTPAGLGPRGAGSKLALVLARPGGHGSFCSYTRARGEGWRARRQARRWRTIPHPARSRPCSQPRTLFPPPFRRGGRPLARGPGGQADMDARPVGRSGLSGLRRLASPPCRLAASPRRRRSWSSLLALLFFCPNDFLLFFCSNDFLLPRSSTTLDWSTVLLYYPTFTVSSRHTHIVLSVLFEKY
jgi:hypothetical protein